MAVLDENARWPTQGAFEYESHYSSRKEVVGFEAFDDRQGFDHVVIGAGPVGAALAYALARGQPDGRVLVVEKNWDEPDRIVGELMQPAGCQALERLGLGGVFSGIGAVPVHGYHIAYRGQHLYVPFMADADGTPFHGNSFHHGRLVMNLRAACKAQPNIVCLEAAATELLGDTDPTGRFTLVRGARIGPPRASELTATQVVDVLPRGLTFVCDGISSQFRRQLNPAPVEMLSHFCGLVLDHEPVGSADDFDRPAGGTADVARPGPGNSNPLPMPHNGNVLLDGIGPVLLYQMSERQTRVLADIPGAQLPSEASGRLREVLRDSLARAAPSSSFPGLHAKLLDSLDSARRIRCIGSKFIPATANTIDGAVWLGDALNVRHPLTGGGMTIGMWDVVLLAEQLSGRGLPDAREMRRIKARWQWQRRPRALVVNVLSIALYSLFSAETKELALLREACFTYLAQGGTYTMHPSGFLSGLMPSPLMLVYHFFSVAFVAVYLRIANRSAAYPGDALPVRIYSAFYTLYVAAAVILPPVWKELQP
ncbi:Squalene epoxidase [Coemansia spiralis]|nr:Squalene epoxidase [Coemansia spiralis]